MNTTKKIEEEIELIDVEDNERIKPKEKQYKKKKKLKKGLFFSVVFCFVSILFILGCCVFYGTRLVKFYKIYNPKDSSGNSMKLLADSILSTSSFVYEGEGLYNSNGNYIYKGKNVNNYIEYSNMTWRILKINSDNTIDIVLNQSLNNLKWNSEITDFVSSDINMYLKEKVVSYLNNDLITNTLICEDLINDVSKISCNSPDSSLEIRLLNIDEFLNSSVDNKSFISAENGTWLSNRGSENAWIINGNSLSYTSVNESYDVLPVVTLKSSNVLLGGKGTKEEPFIIEKDKKQIALGDYVKLDEDIWTVYDYDKQYLSLTLSNLYQEGSKTYRFDLTSNKYNPENESSLAKFLNNDFYNSLSYKELLVEKEWFVGEYNDSYKDIKSEKVKAKVGLTSIEDLKLDYEVNNYYLLNGTTEGKIYLYNNYLIESKPTLSRGIKPSIYIKKTNVKSGTGTLNDPYVLEEK